MFYRPTDQFDISESTPIPADRDQVNGYSRSKAVAERLVATYPGPWSILRPRAVIGPGELPLFRRRDGQTVRCDLTPVQTIAHDIVAAATTTATGAYNLTNGETVELYPFLLDVLRRLDVPAPTRRLP
ncbi:MAG: SDR family oxidoreductase [Actinomycetales bacterium]|nr:SDR family oxidoreductase [Actinomycetales bacterium]